ncbi:MAG: ROK family protein [Micromonosporaceae bacterium]|nr:ROK family protein [Micromonosporaceae bacterium]
MNAKRTTVRDMRRSNRSVILSMLFRDGPLSRHELAHATALSQASVSNLAGDLIAEGLIEEAGSVESDGGRPRTLLRIAPGHRSVIGVDVGETRVRVELFDLSMTALAKADHPLDSSTADPETVVRHVLSGIESVVEQAGVDPGRVLGVGVPGAVEQPEDAVLDAQSHGWESVPLGAMLRAGCDLPIVVDNGAKALGQAEMWFGAGRGARHAVIALVGSGVGAAVVADGANDRGAHGSAGEWGHTTISHGGRECRCGARGCLEAYVGAEAILDRFRQANRGRPAPGADEESALAWLLAADSKTAQRVLAETAGCLGAGVGSLVNLFNPERVVLSGWAGLALGGRFLPEIRAAARKHALRRPYAQTSIELGQLGQDAVAMGAATLPLARLLNQGGADPLL